MKKERLTLLKNVALTREVYELKLAGDGNAFSAPGQFLNLSLEGFFLRRPISICDWDSQSLTLLYKTLGQGTERLSLMQKGESLEALTGLGNGFSLDQSGDKPLLVGGGIGIAPLYKLCRELLKRGAKPTVILGFNRKEEAFYLKEFRDLAQTLVVTLDGSLGQKGFVSDAMSGLSYSYFYTCGPMPMLKAVYKASGEVLGQFSLEERMGCGFGACMGCSIQTLSGAKRVCREGPVFLKEDLPWSV